MKKFLLVLLIALPALFVSGCASILPGHDPIVVNAERTIGVALDTFDVFLKLEYDNHEALKGVSPAIYESAQYIRKNGKRWIKSATDLTRTYKRNRSPENKVSLITAISVLQSAVREAEGYIAKSNP